MQLIGLANGHPRAQTRPSMCQTDRLLLASIHDVSPRFEREVDGLVEMLRTHVGSKMALLVVPNHWGDAPIVQGSGFARRLRALASEGMEVLLHGYFHRDDASHAAGTARLRARYMTAGEGEFLGLSQADASVRIREGRSLIEDIIGRPIDGFVAPAWLYGPAALQALADLGVRLAEDHFRVWSPATGRKLAGGPVITWASRNKARLASSLLAAAALRHVPLKTLRVGVHPPDIRHPRLVRSIKKTLSVGVQTHRPARYSELF
jgi:predicted deacetylase